MKITVFSKNFFLILFLGLFCAGCACFRAEEKSLEVLQEAVRSRMLKLQVTEFLAETANERFRSEKAPWVFSLKTGYQEQVWSVENDLALQVIEDALRYGLAVSSSDPQSAAEKLISARLDFLSVCALVNLQKQTAASSVDAAASLMALSGWSMEKVNSYRQVPLSEVGAPFYAIDLSSERLLEQQGGSAAFDLAADIYRNVDESTLRKAERLRRAMLNRYLMQIKSSGTQKSPELQKAVWRGKMFDSFFTAL